MWTAALKGGPKMYDPALLLQATLDYGRRPLARPSGRLITKLRAAEPTSIAWRFRACGPRMGTSPMRYGKAIVNGNGVGMVHLQE